MSNDQKPDRVSISFGPTKYNSTRATTIKQNQQTQDTQESTVQNITNNPTLNFAGGSGVAVQGTVTSFDITTNTGTATLTTGPSVTFVNGTGVYLSIGDVVAIIVDQSGTSLAIAIISRENQISGVIIPPVVIDTNFPIVTSTLTYPILTNNTVSQYPNIAYDYTGNFGLGTNLVLGPAAALSQTTNALSTDFGINYSIGNTQTFEKWLTPSGILLGFYSGAYQYKVTYSDTNHSLALGSGVLPAFDYTNGNFWYSNTTTPYTRVIYNGTTTPVNGVTTALSISILPSANHGYLYGFSGSNYYRKSSTSNDNWVLIYSGTVIGSSLFWSGGPNGELYRVYTSGGYVQVDKLYNNIITSYNTGIVSTGSLPMGLYVNYLNVVYVLVRTTANVLGTGTGSQYGIGVFGLVINVGTPASPTIAPTTLLATVGTVQSTAANTYACSFQYVQPNSLLWAQYDTTNTSYMVKVNF